jgi:hypothetical protein
MLSTVVPAFFHSERNRCSFAFDKVGQEGSSKNSIWYQRLHIRIDRKISECNANWEGVAQNAGADNY